MMLSPASEEVKKNLTAVVGDNITLDHPGLVEGFLTFNEKVLAKVKNKNLKFYEDDYQNRVSWNQTYGRFTITNLERNDSGVYTIDCKKPHKSSSSYLLTVIGPGPGPGPEPGPGPGPGPEPTPGTHSGGQNQAGGSTTRHQWIVGVAVGVPVGLLIIGAVVAGVLWVKKKRSQDHSRNDQSGDDPASVELRDLRADSSGEAGIS